MIQWDIMSAGVTLFACIALCNHMVNSAAIIFCIKACDLHGKAFKTIFCTSSKAEIIWRCGCDPWWASFVWHITGLSRGNSDITRLIVWGMACNNMQSWIGLQRQLEFSTARYFIVTTTECQIPIQLLTIPRYSDITLYSTGAEPSPALGTSWEVDLDTKLLALAAHRSGKGGENGFTVAFLPTFPIHCSCLVYNSSCKYSSSALSTLSLVSYPFIFFRLLYSPAT